MDHWPAMAIYELRWDLSTGHYIYFDSALNQCYSSVIVITKVLFCSVIIVNFNFVRFPQNYPHTCFLRMTVYCFPFLKNQCFQIAVRLVSPN